MLTDGTQKYVYGLGLTYAVDGAGNVQVYHLDGLGSVRAVTDGSGSVTQTYQTDEFRVPTQSQGSSGQPFQYTGQQSDAENGLYFLRARMYDPAIGRFLSLDRLMGSLGSPLSLNRYTYAQNNPIVFADPSGRDVAGEYAHYLIQDVIGDSATQTAYEWRHSAGILATWPELHRYLRGTFWGNGLGPDLCTRLGGRERVLRDAPALIKRPLGEGAWLQLSEVPPAPREALARLADYLAPLLGWTLEDLRAADRELAVPPAVAPAQGAAARPAAHPPETGAAPRARRRKPVPIEWLPGEEDTGVGLNVYLAAPPSPGQQARVEEVVARWYHDGFEGAFGGAGFHFAEGPSVGGAVLRWYVDLGSADGRRAITELARRLAAVPDVTVRRLVIGTEKVG